MTEHCELEVLGLDTNGPLVAEKILV